MWKKHALVAMVGTLAFAAFGSFHAVAQELRDHPAGPRQPSLSREDDLAYLEARIAALHAGLRLAPEQERIWPPFEQAYRDMANLGSERVASPDGPGGQDPASRLQGRADALIKRGTVLKRLAEATAPLWRSFDEAQRRRFMVLARPGDLETGSSGLLERQLGSNRETEGEASAPMRRDGDRYGPGPRAMAPDARPSDRDGDQGRDRDARPFPPGGQRRDLSREQAGEQGRGQFYWWRGPSGGRGRGWRDGRDSTGPDGGVHGSPARVHEDRGDPVEERL